MRKQTFSFLLCCLLSSVSAADVRLPAIFSNNMVLQRQMPVPVWGFADAGEAVTISVNDQSKTVKAAHDGKWLVKLAAMPAGGPFEMTVRGKNTVEFSNVMVGEVWVCSGQSNMEKPLEQLRGTREEIKQATNSNIRLLTIPKTISGKPKDDVKMSWFVCSPDFADNFSAVAYYFGEYLHSQIDVPIGLIQSTYGGSKIEPWMPPDAFKQIPSLSSTVEYIEGSDQAHRGHIAETLRSLEIYLPVAKKALEAGDQIPVPLKWPVHPLARDKQQPTCLYNGMINPIVPFAIRGAIWYQGEANCNENGGRLYFDKFRAMLGSWRSRWGQGDFPFYFVQLAPFVYGSEKLPLMWEAQAACLQIPGTGMAVTVDIGNPLDIHPQNKRKVGKRLALWALAKDYGMDKLIYSGPLYKSMKVKRNKAVIRFDHVGTGLVSRDGKDLTWFEIAGDEKRFLQAKAVIDGDTVIVSSEKIEKPVAVRFGWNQRAEPNLSNKEGLPAAPFRTDSRSTLITDGLIVDLDADQGVILEDGNRVVNWMNQVVDFPAQNFSQREKGRKIPGSGRPALKENIAALGGHNSLIFREDELINMNEDAFDHLITGSGYTWFTVMSADAQVGRLKDVSVFFGNLNCHPPRECEGFWAGFEDDNDLWTGPRNGLTFGRYNSDNPKLMGPRFEKGKYYVVAGRLAEGTGTVMTDVFVNSPVPFGSVEFPVNPSADASVMAIGTERDAWQHPGQESFHGELARVLFYERCLSDGEMVQMMARLKEIYFDSASTQ